MQVSQWETKKQTKKANSCNRINENSIQIKVSAFPNVNPMISQLFVRQSGVGEEGWEEDNNPIKYMLQRRSESTKGSDLKTPKGPNFKVQPD